MHTMLQLPNGTTLPAQALYVPSKKFSSLKMVSSDETPQLGSTILSGK